MTILSEHEPTSSASGEPVRARPRPGKVIVAWFTTTDHKIGSLYLITSFLVFLFGGILALLMRAELARPGLQFLSNEQSTRPSPCTARSCC